MNEPQPAVRTYEPPTQSRRGQLFDTLFLLVLVFAVLFGVTYFKNWSSPAGPTSAKPLSQLRLTADQRAQYRRLIDEGLVDLQTVNAQVADNQPQAGSKKYPIGLGAAVATFGVIGAYLFFIYFMSFREYRGVVHDHFGPPVGEADATLERKPTETGGATA